MICRQYHMRSIGRGVLESGMKKTQLPAAIITGAGSGIGRAVAIGLGAKGYRLVLAGRRLDLLKETGASLGEEGVDWVAVSADIAKHEDRMMIIEQGKGFGCLHTVVNNAALGTCKKLGDLSEVEIEALFAVNATGPIALVRLALPELIKSRGCVVNVASVAMLDPFVGLGVYGCTKAAIDGLTRTIHNEYGEQGVRAYTIAPGAVETAMLRSIVSEETLPQTNTLSPEQVAGKIIACVTGEVSEPAGSTMVINSP